MKESEHGPADTLVEIDLDDEQLARLDELIEEHSTPSHRVTREEMLLLLVEKGRERVGQGESLFPFLEPPAAETAEETAPSSAPGPGHETKH
jgi:hypothetical protein